MPPLLVRRAAALARRADAFVQASLTAYAVASIAVCALALWLFDRRSGSGVIREIF
jgi:hypothetical protein